MRKNYIQALYDEDGIPLGSNGAIAKRLSKLMGFKLNSTLYPRSGSFNSSSGLWTDSYYDVSCFQLNFSDAFLSGIQD